MARVNVMKLHAGVMPAIPATVVTQSSGGTSSASFLYEAEDRRFAWHPCVVFDHRWDQQDNTWEMEVCVCRTYDSELPDPASIAKDHPRHHIPVPHTGADGSTTKHPFEPPLDTNGYLAVKPTWLVALKYSLPMGSHGAYKPFEPQAALSSSEADRLELYVIRAQYAAGPDRTIAESYDPGAPSNNPPPPPPPGRPSDNTSAPPSGNGPVRFPAARAPGNSRGQGYISRSIVLPPPPDAYGDIDSDDDQSYYESDALPRLTVEEALEKYFPMWPETIKIRTQKEAAKNDNIMKWLINSC
ncbi:hypothetical protein FN846DRAFT_1001173 [Sphaerosporella brunnea]|uniref:Uncharacterized protein n=1 Tax=Sphaerosporella brunnea TaxID=1250544 RepID=A0A5J5EFV2_9PEZI|nr:hypothetical protein FN846DRAFT_1001173 [Sphaerosporella brunnea]